MMSNPENERLFNAIECALKMLHKGVGCDETISHLRESFPSPVFFVESDAYVKRKLGFSESDAYYFTLIPTIARYIVQERFGDRPVLNRLSAMTEYVIQLYHGVYHECFYGLLLDAHGRLLDTALISRGSTNATLFDLKMLLCATIQKSARTVVLCHNHPRGTPRPSEEDVRCTLDALKALKALNVPMLDHIIVAYDRAISMRACGVIPAEIWAMQAPNSRILRNWLNGINI